MILKVDGTRDCCVFEGIANYTVGQVGRRLIGILSLESNVYYVGFDIWGFMS